MYEFNLYHNKIIIKQLKCHNRSTGISLDISVFYGQSILLLKVMVHWCAILRTRSQAVARIADRIASQHLCGSRDVIGHVAI